MTTDNSDPSIESGYNESSHELVIYNPHAPNPFRDRARVRQHRFNTDEAADNEFRTIGVALGRVDSRTQQRHECRGRQRLSRHFPNLVRGQPPTRGNQFSRSRGRHYKRHAQLSTRINSASTTSPIAAPQPIDITTPGVVSSSIGAPPTDSITAVVTSLPVDATPLANGITFQATFNTVFPVITLTLQLPSRGISGGGVELEDTDEEP